MSRRTLLWLGVAALVTPVRAWGGDVVDRYPWMEQWVHQDGIEREWLNNLLGDLPPYLLAVEAMDRQAEAKPYHQYRRLFLRPRLIARGRELMSRHRSLLRGIQERYGVPGEYLVALWGIESSFGGNTGRHPVLRSLFTLATRYPRRAEFFQGELRHFLLLCREEGWDPRAVKGSFAGAMSQAQMIPSTLRTHAVDHDGDGHRNPFTSTPDVLASIANYLRQHGWRAEGEYALRVQPGEGLAGMVSASLDQMRPWEEWTRDGVALGEGRPPRGDEPAALIMLEQKDGADYYVVFGNFRAVTKWNNSRRFAMVVEELAREMRGGS